MSRPMFHWKLHRKDNDYPSPSLVFFGPTSVGRNVKLVDAAFLVFLNACGKHRAAFDWHANEHPIGTGEPVSGKRQPTKENYWLLAIAT